MISSARPSIDTFIKGNKMNVNVALFVLFAAVAQSALAAKASPEIDCMGVKVDAKFGAEKARSGQSMEQALEAIARSGKTIDAELIKTKRKPMTIAMKTQMKMSFLDGYHEALRQPDLTVDQIAGQAFLSCEFAKHK